MIASCILLYFLHTTNNLKFREKYYFSLQLVIIKWLKVETVQLSKGLNVSGYHMSLFMNSLCAYHLQMGNIWQWFVAFTNWQNEQYCLWHNHILYHGHLDITIHIILKVGIIYEKHPNSLYHPCWFFFFSKASLVIYSLNILLFSPPTFLPRQTPIQAYLLYVFGPSLKC